MLLLVNLQAPVCDFTKTNTLPCVSSTFLKLYKRYQIAQSVSYLMEKEISILQYFQA